MTDKITFGGSKAIPGGRSADVQCGGKIVGVIHCGKIFTAWRLYLVPKNKVLADDEAWNDFYRNFSGREYPDLSAALSDMQAGFPAAE